MTYRHFLPDYLKYRFPLLFYLLCSCIFFSISFALYHLPLKAVLYPSLICASVLLLLLLYDFVRFLHKRRHLHQLLRLPENLLSDLSIYSLPDDRDYQAIIEQLLEQQYRLRTEKDSQLADMIDYYTTWAHQIKTPIASMELALQNEDSPLSRKLSGDLFRIEEYVEMVLCYLRLGGDSTDYVFRKCNLDDILRQSLRKYAGSFISRGITLDYRMPSASAPEQLQVITDEKWLAYVIEQVLSNALKYTPPKGSISIFLEAPAILCIRDTGIGIAAEDLPRIFEKGYTGYNGRSDKKATGLGLYLCSCICKNLGYSIEAVSQPDRGTTIRIHLEQQLIQAE